ncbi:hypothetical protein [Mycoplasma simbae]|uniref:hypothetical protein n=1 Tax=Mycoplasma simbae TaxID=36744 RepID=UPI000497E1C9|nr:hypothetical protein [Mycoplasma simbae]
MRKKTKALALLSVVASVATTTAVMLNISSFGKVNPQSNNNTTLKNIDSINKILVQDLNNINNNKQVSQSDKVQYKKDLEQAKTVYGEYSSARTVSDDKVQEKLNILFDNIEKLEARLTENKKLKDTVDLSELEKRVNEQTYNLSVFDSITELSSVFNEFDHISRSLITNLNAKLEKIEDTQIKNKFKKLVDLNTQNQSATLNKIKKQLKIWSLISI